MIPIRDDTPRSTIPFVNYFLIVLNTLVFLFQQTLPPRGQELFLNQFAFIPERVHLWLLGDSRPEAAFLPVLTSMFMHAGWAHLISNMWVLAIFGDNIEDRLGHFKYLSFYLVCGLGAEALHLFFNLHSRVPSLGASGAIAGVMGAYFLLFPSARVLTWFFVFVIWLPAWLVLGYWFIVQFLSGAASAMVTASQNTGGVAFWAHVGGFFTGMALIKLFPARRPKYAYYDN